MKIYTPRYQIVDRNTLLTLGYATHRIIANSAAIGLFETQWRLVAVIDRLAQNGKPNAWTVDASGDMNPISIKVKKEMTDHEEIPQPKRKARKTRKKQKKLARPLLLWPHAEKE